MKTSILVVDDDDSVRKSITRMLATRGFHVVGARDADEAFELALQHLPAVMIVDIHLPLLPGNYAVRKFREHPRLGQTAFIALSATIEDVEPGLFDHALPKPCTSEALIAAISDVVSAKSPRRDAKGVPEQGS